MPSSRELVDPLAPGFEAPPDPGQAGTLDELVEQLRLLKVWAGDPSYERITDRINAAWGEAGRPATELARKNTVADCFKAGRRRMNTDLVIAVVQALHPDVGYVTQWRQALRVVGGETQAASQVRVQDRLPPDLAEFTGRTPELDQLRRALHDGRQGGGAVVISAIEGMAGVGKTQLAVHAAHLLVRHKGFDRVLFVNLRGFHPDPAQPPADPASVLDGFLRLLGVPGQQIPHDLLARSAAYRGRLAGSRALIVLDNAVDAEQVRPLLPDTPGCLALVTSRRSLTELHPATHLTVDVFTPEEAVEFLIRAVPDVPAGADPQAAARIARRCGHLPLALGLVAGHIRGIPGWTLTDHADRLDERHHDRHLDTGVELALALSYQRLPAGRQRLFRLAALHPGQDLDAHAAAALAGIDAATAEEHLDHLCRDHLLQPATPGRYGLHDLVRAYATGRAGDEDPPRQRRDAVTRLLDYYLAATTTAMKVAYPYERALQPAVPPAGIPTPDLSNRDRAERWLDAELANLLAAAQHAAKHGWPEHNWRLLSNLDRHLRTRGRQQDAETLHHQALDLARDLGNRAAELKALNRLGHAHRILGSYERAGDDYRLALPIAEEIEDRLGELEALHGLGHVHRMLCRYEEAGAAFGRALRIAEELGDRGGELISLNGFGAVHRMLGRYEDAIDHFGRALRIAEDVGDRVGELQALHGLGTIHLPLGRYDEAGEVFGRALKIAEDVGDRVGERHALHGLGHVNRMLGHYEEAGDQYERALQMARETSDRVGVLRALNSLGHIHRMLGRHGKAAGCYEQVSVLARELGSRNWEFEALQGLGRLHFAAGHPDLALAHHEQALRYATELSQPADEARAHDGLAHAHRALGAPGEARKHWRQALDILARLGTDHTEEVEVNVPAIREHLAEPGDD